MTGVDSQETTLRVRLLQTDPELGDVTGNLGRLDALVRDGVGSDLIVAPELATHGYHLSDVSNVDPLEPSDARLLGLGSHGPAVITGFAEARHHRTFNSAALVQGSQVTVQRKMFLPTYRGWEERKHFRPGSTLREAAVPKARIGILICNDAWQPPLPWLAVHGGAEVLVVPVNSAVSDIGVSTASAWHILLTHTAVVLQSFVVFVNRCGVESGREFWGGSRVYHPSGDQLVCLDEHEDSVDTQLDLSELRDLRRRWPLLQETRADLVATAARRIADEED